MQIQKPQRRLRFFFACFHASAQQDGGAPVFIPWNGLKKKRYLVFLFADLLTFLGATISIRLMSMDREKLAVGVLPWFFITMNFCERDKNDQFQESRICFLCRRRFRRCHQFERVCLALA
nr:hypothetical protein [uncultured Janthinobacterium sp.]